MVKTVGMVVMALALAAPAVARQQDKVEQKPAPTAAKVEAPRPEPPGLNLNVKVEVTITDQAGPGDAAKKTISMIVGDRQNNSIRSSTQVRTGGGYRTVGINLDARPWIDVKDQNRVQLMFGLEYPAENTVRRRHQRAGPVVADAAADAGARVWQVHARLAGGGSDLRPQDHRRSYRDDPEIAFSASPARLFAL